MTGLSELHSSAYGAFPVFSLLVFRLLHPINAIISCAFLLSGTLVALCHSKCPPGQG